ncbi:MAG: hypothetical protein J6W88_05090 [Bacteroidales bacterium]|nr:hypothetical protein [Bacteroidales bacterium]
MKKTTIKMIGVVLYLIATLGMVSCTPEEKEEFSLVGKTYAATKYYGSYGTVFDAYTAYYVIRFTSSNTIECSDRKNGIHGELLGSGKIVNGTYTLNYPNIHLEYDDPMLSSNHHSEDGVFVDESCFRIGNKDYVLY